MILERLEVTSYLMNCYLLACDSTKECAIIDPGGGFELINEKIEELGLLPKMILLTHAHGDHIGAIGEIKNKYDIPVYVHKFDAEMLKDSKLNYSYELFRKNYSYNYDKTMEDGDIIKIGKLDVKVIHTPGHTLGGVCFKVEDFIITGDTIFDHSIGRTDFEGGSIEQIISSIVNKILIYDDNTILCPGHNGYTKIGIEKKENIFVKRFFE